VAYHGYKYEILWYLLSEQIESNCTQYQIWIILIWNHILWIHTKSANLRKVEKSFQSRIIFRCESRFMIFKSSNIAVSTLTYMLSRKCFIRFCRAIRSLWEVFSYRYVLEADDNSEYIRYQTLCRKLGTSTYLVVPQLC